MPERHELVPRFSDEHAEQIFKLVTDWIDWRWPPKEIAQQKVAPSSSNVKVKALPRGRRKDPLYDKAFDALYVRRKYETSRQAFDAILVPTLGNPGREAAFNSFNKAMDRRKKKTEEPTTK